MILYHYCPNSSFLSIVSGSSIRASDFSLSNDLLEGKWTRKLLSDFCSRKSMDPTLQSLLLKEFDGLYGFYGAVGFCLSEDGDLLSQWRGYADDGGGVAIGFECEFFRNLAAANPGHPKGFIRNDSKAVFLCFIEVQYNLKKQLELVEPHFEKILVLTNGGAFDRLLSKPSLPSEQADAQRWKLKFALLEFAPHLYALKNPAFQEEKEWRLIALNFLPSAAQDPRWALSVMEFHPKRDRLVPYVSFSLDPGPGGTHPIREVILGPKNITPEVSSARVRKVRRSSASYR